MPDAYPVNETKPKERPRQEWGIKSRGLGPTISRLRQLNGQLRAVDSLNAAPVLFLCGAVFGVFATLSAFLEYYVITSTGIHLGIFAVGSYIVFSSYFVMDHYLGKLSSSYTAIPDDKRFYVISNLVKSGVLLAYSPMCAKLLYSALLHDEWSTPRIRNMGVLYAIPDFVSLLLVRRMATSTKIHHVCVVLFMLVNLVVEYEHESVGRALVVYAVFSTFAYGVNLLLASRFLAVSEVLAFIMSTLALLIYGSCLAVNWTWQLAFLSRLWMGDHRWSLPLYVYVALISLVVYDDVVLMKWLWGNVCRILSDKQPQRRTRSD
jgi:hypothetical protein